MPDTGKKFINLFKQYGVDINQVDQDSKTPLDEVYRKHYSENVIQYLKSIGAKTAAELEDEKRKQLVTE